MTALLPRELVALLADVPALRRAYLVGGGVRDGLLGAALKDFDLEVFGVDYEQLTAALAPHGRVDLLGRSFGVIKLTTRGGHTYDFSIPGATRKPHRGTRASKSLSIRTSHCKRLPRGATSPSTR